MKEYPLRRHCYLNALFKLDSLYFYAAFTLYCDVINKCFILQMDNLNVSVIFLQPNKLYTFRN